MFFRIRRLEIHSSIPNDFDSVYLVVSSHFGRCLMCWIFVTFSSPACNGCGCLLGVETPTVRRLAFHQATFRRFYPASWLLNPSCFKHGLRRRIDGLAD